MSYRTAEFLRCREVCVDCPMRGSNVDTRKEHCVHLWRHLVQAELMVSGDGTVSFSTPERAVALGAKVGFSDGENTRPSIELFDTKPDHFVGFQVARLRKVA